MKYMTLEQIASVLIQKNKADSRDALIQECSTYEIEDANDILQRLQKLNCKKPDFVKLISQLRLALGDESLEAKNFIKSLELFMKSFDASVDVYTQIDNRNALSKRIHNKKLQYNVIKCFYDVYNDIDDGTIMRANLELLVKNPYATAEDVIDYCYSSDDEDSLNSKMLKRGFDLFDQEFDRVCKQDKPDFSRLSYIIDSFAEKYIYNYYLGNDEDLSDFAEIVSKYSPQALKMRVRIAVLEKENKKLKSQIRAQKTTELQKGTVRVAKKNAEKKRQGKEIQR